MRERIKLIWDFRGPHGEQTAKHHEKHLQEYVVHTNLENTATGQTTYHEMHSIAFLVVDADDMPATRDALKPHRGEKAN